MVIKDDIYGEFIITGVLEELINSRAVQRLKGIHQGGASYLVNKDWSVTRYEHSIGVMLLIKKLGGSMEQQIAGLLHDISHTAFSHVIDFVFDNKEEDFHEQKFSQIIENSDIPEILTRHGYKYEDLVLDHSQWSLLEQPAPFLCADRVDYTLRDMYQYGQIRMDEVNSFLEKLIVWEGRMVLRDIGTAEWFVKIYYKETINFFMDPLNIYGYHLLTGILQLAFQKQIISMEDMFKTDAEVMDLLHSADDEDINVLLKKLHDKVTVTEDKNEYDFHHKNKIRHIDPEILVNDRPVKSSAISKDIRKITEDSLTKAIEGIYVKVIRK
jgi:uncharacterized protein